MALKIKVIETAESVKKQINKRTVQCLIHRYLYYIRAAPLITDEFYDTLERDLRRLVTAHPEQAKDVPFVRDVLESPGSDLIDSYARLVGIEELADSPTETCSKI